MKLNWHPDKVAFLDYETMSCCDIDVGSRKYAKHPTTRVACATMKVDGQYFDWTPDFDATELFQKIAANRVIVAHNASFDARIQERFAPGESHWFDTLCTARASGLPGKLDQLGLAFQGRGKDPVGKQLIDMISKVKIKNGEPQYFVGTDHVWKKFLEYNRRDVDLLEMVYEKTKANVEPDVMTVDRIINDRGIPVHVPLLKYIAVLDEYNRGVSGEKFMQLTGDVNPRSTKQMLKWLGEQGFSLETVNKVKLHELVQKPEEYFEGDPDDCPAAMAGVEEALRYRNDLVRVGQAKIATGLALEDDGRVYDQFVYHGAHTGRWSGRAWQPHNFPQMVDRLDVHEILTGGPLDYDRLCEFAEKATIEMKKDEPTARCYVGSIINSLLRACVRSSRGPITVIDYGAVEARCMAWLSGCRPMLDAFKDTTRDFYREYAVKMYGYEVAKDSFERFVAKQIILGCCYGMSGGGFKRAFERFLTTMLGKKEGRLISQEEADKFVGNYRESFQEIPKLWKLYGDACMDAVKHGRHTSAGRCEIYRDNRDLVVQLPSGRRLFYRNAYIDWRIPTWAKLRGLSTKVQTIVFQHPHGYEGYLYGGRIAENVSQGTCRDLLGWAMVDLDKEKLDPFGHVHDECMSETGDGARVASVMSTPPEWAAGFPLLVEGYVGPYWTKQPKKPDFKSLKYLNGAPV